MKKDQEKLEKQLTETQAENRKLQDPLQKVCCTHALGCLCKQILAVCVHISVQAREEVAELQKQLYHYERDKVSLAVSSPDTHWPCIPVSYPVLPLLPLLPLCRTLRLV